MATSYSKIYDIFLSKITDFDLPILDDEELTGYCHDIFLSALVKLKSFDHNLSDRNEEESSFNTDLSDLECEVIACQMVAEWVEKKIDTTQLMHMFVGTKDESMTSQANHMKELIEVKEKHLATVSRLIRDFKYQKWLEEEEQ